MSFSKYVENNTLTIKYNKINISDLVTFLQARPDITELSLIRCNIGPEGAKEIANGNLTNLTRLDLPYNNIGNEGAKAIEKSLNKGHFPELVTINLDGNPEINYEIKNRINRKLQDNQQKRNTNLSNSLSKEDSTFAPSGPMLLPHKLDDKMQFNKIEKFSIAASVILAVCGIVAGAVMATKFKMPTEGIITGTACITIAAVVTGLMHLFCQPSKLLDSSSTDKFSSVNTPPSIQL